MITQHQSFGRLVPAHPATLTAGRGDFLKCQQAALERPAVARFVDHLMAPLAEP